MKLRSRQQQLSYRTRCSDTIPAGPFTPERQCTLKVWKEGRCKWHHPDGVSRRLSEAMFALVLKVRLKLNTWPPDVRARFLELVAADYCKCGARVAEEHGPDCPEGAS